MDMDLLPPELTVTPDLNLKIRIRVLSKILYELTDACGADCSDSIERGILNRQIVKNIIISFVDDESIIRSEVELAIDWDKLEFSAKVNSDVTLLQNLDLNKLVSRELDPALYRALKVHIKKLKEKYRIVRVETHYRYREQYKKTDEIYEATKKYMHHITDSATAVKDTSALSREIEVAFQGIDGCLDVLFRV